MGDYSNANHLPTEVKILIVNGRTVVADAKEMMRNGEYRLDLTSKMQIKSDCKEVEKYIKLVMSGKGNEKNYKKLELSIVRLQTTIDGLVKFYTR